MPCRVPFRVVERYTQAHIDLLGSGWRTSGESNEQSRGEGLCSGFWAR